MSNIAGDPCLDTKGRVKFDGSLCYKFKSFSEFIPTSSGSDLLNNLQADCRDAFCYRQNDDASDTISVESTDYHNDGCTFFLKANQIPRCGLEMLASRVFQLHTEHANFDPSNSGAEWWTQVVDSNSDIGFHWDKDYAYEQNTGVNLYPHLGTVTYLTDCGGPTVALKLHGRLQSSADHSGKVGDIAISKPQIGKHIKFDGQLLHAAPAGLCTAVQQPDKPTIRITFLVNIWLNHIPIRTTPFPNHLVNSAKSSVSWKDTFGPTEHGAHSAPKKVVGKAVKVPQLPLIVYQKNKPLPLDLHSWKFNNGNRKYVIYVPLPSNDRLTRIAHQQTSFSFIYAGSGVESKVELLAGHDISHTTKKPELGARKRSISEAEVSQSNNDSLNLDRKDIKVMKDEKNSYSGDGSRTNKRIKRKRSKLWMPLHRCVYNFN